MFDFIDGDAQMSALGISPLSYLALVAASTAIVALLAAPALFLAAQIVA